MKGFSLVERDLFPLCNKTPLFYTPFLIADHCQELVPRGSEDSSGDKSGAMSQVLIMPFLHWKGWHWDIQQWFFRLWKVAYSLHQLVSRGPKLLDQENAWRIAGYGADRMVVERKPKAESPDGCMTYSLHMWILQCLLPSSRQCNASRLVQQWKANNSCSVVRGHLLRIQICYLSTESAALWYSTLGRDVFASWYSLFLAPDSWLPHLVSTCCHPGGWRRACLCADELVHQKDLLFPALRSRQRAMSQWLLTWFAKYPTC